MTRVPDDLDMTFTVGWMLNIKNRRTFFLRCRLGPHPAALVVVGAGLLFAPVRCLTSGEFKQLLLLARHVNGFGTSGFMLFTRNHAAFVLGTF